MKEALMTISRFNGRLTVEGHCLSIDGWTAPSEKYVCVERKVFQRTEKKYHTS